MKTKYLLIFLLVVLSSLVVRFYNFEKRINFGPEQALSLIVSSEYIKTKPTLLGLPNVQRRTSQGHIIYSGSLFNYSLVPMLIVGEYDPLVVTVFFGLINIVIGILFFLVVKKYFDDGTAMASMVLFLFNAYMINHSMYIWILNYLPLIGVLSLGSLLEYNRTKKTWWIFCLGILSGIGFNLEYMYFLTAVMLLAYLAYKAKNKLKTLIFFILGGVIGNLPMVLFELRNGFYHARTLIEYAADSFHKQHIYNVAYYHFFQFWPIFCLVGAIFLTFLYKKSKILTALMLLVYIGTNLTSKWVSFSSAAGMKEGTNYQTVLQAAKAINEDEPSNFNVVTILDFDMRGYVLRYFLKYIYNKPVEGVEDYGQAKKLYVLASSDYDFTKDPPWEITAMGESEKQVIKTLQNNFKVYKLTKK